MIGTRAKILKVLSLAALLPVFAGGCATGGAAAGGDANTTLIVKNDLIPPTSLTIYAFPEFGGRVRVGTVNPGATATLPFRASAATGEYRFVGQTTAGNEIASTPVTFSPGATLRWDLTSNIATVVDPGG